MNFDKIYQHEARLLQALAVILCLLVAALINL